MWKQNEHAASAPKWVLIYSAWIWIWTYEFTIGKIFGKIIIVDCVLVKASAIEMNKHIFCSGKQWKYVSKWLKNMWKISLEATKLQTHIHSASHQKFNALFSVIQFKNTSRTFSISLRVIRFSFVLFFFLAILRQSRENINNECYF